MDTRGNDETAVAGEPDSPDDRGEFRSRLRLRYRLVGTVVIAALIVALYAVIQFASSERTGDLSSSAALGQTIRSQNSGNPPLAGELAPDFSVPTLDGLTFSLNRHLAWDGRPVFLNMWAEWCFPCRAEMPAIDALSRDHPEIHFIGVVIRDSESPVRRFIDEFNVTYQIGLDTERLVENTYYVWVMPTTYLIGSDGIIIERFFGPMTDKTLGELIRKLPSAGT